MPRHRESVMQRSNIQLGFGACVLPTPSTALTSLTQRSSRRPQAPLVGALRASHSGAAYLGRYAVTRVVGEANVWRLK